MDHYRPEIASSCQSVKQGQYISRQERQTHEQTHRHRHPITWVQRQPCTKFNEHTHLDKRIGRTPHQTRTCEKVAQVGWPIKQLQTIVFRHLSLLLSLFTNIINKLHSYQ